MSAEIAIPVKPKYPSQTPEHQHKYYTKFYAKCQEQGTQICPVCFGNYTYFNKSHHNKSAHHQRAVAYQQYQQAQGQSTTAN